jgi:hypothetical protein
MLMFLRYMSDEELKQYSERVARWLSDSEKAKIASEIESRTPEGQERLREARRKAAERRHNISPDDHSGKFTVPYELMWRSLPHGEDR